ncbi:MAG: RrF2 family transcriptional regulator [Planctomycetota bacterium]|jgi:Rrf2 family protein
MSGLLKISEAAVLAVHTAALLAGEEGRVMTTHEAAEYLGASEAHLSKVLQRLSRSGLVNSVRGPKGGFSLARPAGEVTLLEVYEAMDGPLPEGRCLLDTSVCEGRCILGNVLCEVGETVKRRFEGTTLADVSDSLKAGGARCRET